MVLLSLYRYTCYAQNLCLTSSFVFSFMCFLPYEHHNSTENNNYVTHLNLLLQESYIRISAQLMMNKWIFLSHSLHTLPPPVIYQGLPVFLHGVLHNCPLLSFRLSLFYFNQNHHQIILRLLQLSANWTPSLKTLGHSIHCIKHPLINLAKMIFCSCLALLENFHTSLQNKILILMS